MESGGAEGVQGARTGKFGVKAAEVIGGFCLGGTELFDGYAIVQRNETCA